MVDADFASTRRPLFIQRCPSSFTRWRSPKSVSTRFEGFSKCRQHLVQLTIELPQRQELRGLCPFACPPNIGFRQCWTQRSAIGECPDRSSHSLQRAPDNYLQRLQERNARLERTRLWAHRGLPPAALGSAYLLRDTRWRVLDRRRE